MSVLVTVRPKGSAKGKAKIFAEPDGGAKANPYTTDAETPNLFDWYAGPGEYDLWVDGTKVASVAVEAAPEPRTYFSTTAFYQVATVTVDTLMARPDLRPGTSTLVAAGDPIPLELVGNDSSPRV